MSKLDRYCIRVYNDRYFKVSVCHGDRDGLPVFSGNDRTNERRIIGDDEMIDNLKRSARRAYSQLIAKGNGLGVDRMLTLTFAKNVVASCKSEAMKCFARFTRLCRKKFGTFNYVATSETQKRGAIHFHLGVTMYYNVFILWELWKRAIIASNLAESDDKVGSVFINKKWKNDAKRRGVVRYIAKYIIKESYKFIQNASGLRDKFGKRYFSSKVKEEKIIFISTIALSINDYCPLRFIFRNNIAFFEEKIGKIAFLDDFKSVSCFILGMNWSFSQGFFR
jgi:hypothetical protein